MARRQGDCATALRLYDAAQTSAARNNGGDGDDSWGVVEERRLARLGTAKCHIALKDFDAAREVVTEELLEMGISIDGR
jgi:hypothetical protein